MDPIELVAAVLGVICVWLIIRRNVWNFPFGIAMVVLYAWVFYGAKLYSDALLQLYFIGVQVYGWNHWLKHRDKSGNVAVGWLSYRSRLGYAGLIVLGVLALGGFMSTYTDAALPWWDAGTTILSVVAQWLLSRRKTENWILWIIVDVIGIFIYWHRELYFTMGLYTLLLGMASWGFVTWLRTLKCPVSAESAA